MKLVKRAVVWVLLAATPPAMAAPEEKVSVCHVPEGDGRLAEVILVSPTAVAGHQRHGDLVGAGTIHVSAAAAFPGRGTAGEPFRRISDAIALARCVRRAAGELTSAAGTLTIDVASGEYLGAFSPEVLAQDPTREELPLVANAPGVVYLGHTVTLLDDAGLPAGAVAGTETILRAEPPLVSTSPNGEQALFLITDTTDGLAGNRTTLEGFVLRSGNRGAVKAGLAVLTLRSDDLVLRGNVVDDFFGAGLDTRDSDVELAGNFITGVGACGMCVMGPGSAWVHGNRSSGNTSGGIITGPGLGPAAFDLGARPLAVAPYVLAPAVHLEALLEDNDLTGNTANRNNSFGERHFTSVARIPTQASSRVVSRRNRLWNNPYGVLVDAGQPDRRFPPYAVQFDGDFSGDHFERAPQDGTRNCRAGVFASMTRFATSLPFNRAAQLLTNRYLDGSRYDLVFPEDVTFWVDNSDIDPGPPAPTEVWNVVWANGDEVPRGTYVVPLPSSTLPCVMNP